MAEDKTHICPDLLIRCMDYRLSDDLHSFVQRKCPEGVCDILSVPGGAGAVLDPKYQKGLLAGIKIFVKNHGGHRVILTCHRDCGAYGGSTSFKDHDQELARYESDLRTAQKIIQRHFPKISIERYFLELKSGQVLPVKL